MEEPLQFKLEGFEGPLDLLLHLIAKHKLDIQNIEITILLTQYLDYIGQMKRANMEIAASFLSMAARLVYIKTASLLPKYEEESEQLKRELSGQLIEYQLLKEVVQKMQQRYQDGIYIRSPMEIKADLTYSFTHDSTVLAAAYLAAAGRGKRRLPPPRAAFSQIVSRRIVPVESRILYVLDRLYREDFIPYETFFESGDRSERVATFLAMLELIKTGRICVSDDNKTVYFAPGQPPQEKEAQIYDD